MLNTEKMEKIIVKFGGDLNAIETNLESERLDYLLEEVNAGGFAPRHVSFYAFPYDDVSPELVGIDGSNLISLASAFSNSKTLTSLDLSKLNTSNVTTMNGLCSSSTALTTVSLKGCDTSKVTNMDSMFASCSALTSVDLSGIDTSELINFRYPFRNCSKLATIDLSSIVAPKGQDFQDMFSNCSALTSVDLSNLNSSASGIKMSYMFSGCKALKHIDLRSMSFSKVTSSSSMLSSVPTDCEIIVKDDTEKAWFASKFSNYTNVKTVAELG